MPTARAYSPLTIEAGRLLGAQVRLARLERRWSQKDLAERAGITPETLGKVERGELSVGLGTAFEVAVLTGVPLFHQERSHVRSDLDRTLARSAVLPQRVRLAKEPVKDDF